MGAPPNHSLKLMSTWSRPAGANSYSSKTQFGLKLIIQILEISSAIIFSKGLQCQYARQETAVAEQHLGRRSEE